jgi:hypothetical protein
VLNQRVLQYDLVIRQYVIEQLLKITKLDNHFKVQHIQKQAHKPLLTIQLFFCSILLKRREDFTAEVNQIAPAH